MSTIACESCGAVLSDAAEKCPKCRYPTPKNQGRCRKCYTILAYSDHRYKRYSGNVVNGTTSGSSYIQHVPCTNCGEPEPLGKPVGPHVPWWRRILGLLIAITGLYISFFYILPMTWNNSVKTKTMQQSTATESHSTQHSSRSK